MVMDVLGPHLASLMQRCGSRFSLKTVLMLFDQMISRLEFVHSRGIVHRDVKPENFLLGRTKEDMTTVYLIDFGLSKKYRYPNCASSAGRRIDIAKKIESEEKEEEIEKRVYTHIPFQTNKPLIGSARFASLNAHSSLEQGRKDDLESLAYVCIYLYKGHLPWNDIQGNTAEDTFRSVHYVKLRTPVEELCFGLPSEFVWYVNYCRSLHFETRPDYALVRSVMGRLFSSLKYVWDNVFDWIDPSFDATHTQRGGAGGGGGDL